jgi:hypothetical protein
VIRFLLAAVTVIALIALVALPSMLDDGSDLGATQAPIVLEPRAGPSSEETAERRRSKRLSPDG